MTTTSKHKLLWEYYIKGSRSAEARLKHFEILLELIETEELAWAPVFPNTSGPESEYEERRRRLADAFTEILLRQPDNPRVLRNYCTFLLRSEPRRALEIGERLVQLEPNDPTNHALNAYGRAQVVRDSTNDEEKRRESENALSSLRSVIGLRGEDTAARDLTLCRLAWLAYRVGRSEEARDAAARAVDAYRRGLGERESGEVVRPEVLFNACTVLGLLALDQGALNEASEQLLASVDFPPPRQLHFVALDLGRRLLEIGAVEVVREFAEKLIRAVGCGPWQSDVVEFHDQVTRAGSEKSH